MSTLPPELKYTVNNTDNAILSTTWTLLNLTGIAQGDTVSSRQGSRITPEWIRMKAMVTPELTTAYGGGTVELRRIVFIDRGGIGAVPAQTDVFNTNSNPRSLKNYQNSQRFIILKDDYVPVINSSSSGAGTIQPFCDDLYVDLSKYFRRVGKVTSYTGTGATSADIGQGAVYIAWITDQTLGSGSGNTGLAYTASLGYFDN